MKGRTIDLCIAFLLFSLFEGGHVCSAPVDQEIRLYDTVKLRNGSVLRGIIKGVDNETVTMALLGSDGTIGKSLVRIPKAQIAEILPRKTPGQILQAELKRRDPFNPSDLMDLAMWCKRPEVGFYEEGAVLAHRALRLDPSRKELYGLLEELLAKKPITSLTREEKEREVEVALLAVQNGAVIPGQFLRASMVLREFGSGGTKQFLLKAAEFAKLAFEKGSDQVKVRASQILAHTLLDLGRVHEAVQVIEASSSMLSETEKKDLVVRLLQIGGKEGLQLAAKLCQRLTQGRERKLLEAAVDFFQGDISQCKSLLSEVLEKEPSSEVAQALALVLALEGKKKTAAAILEVLKNEGPDKALLKYVLGVEGSAEEVREMGSEHKGLWLVLAWDEALRGDMGKAEAFINSFRKGGELTAEEKQLCWIILGAAAFKNRSFGEAERYLRYAQKASAREIPGLPFALSTLCALRGDLAQAKALVAKASEESRLAQLALLAKAYVAYCEKNLDLAESLLSSLEKLESTPPDLSRYLTTFRQILWEAKNLEVWQDDFDRQDSEDVLNGWFEEESYGVRISLKERSVLFAGKQSDKEDSTTKLYRFLNWGRFFRVEAEIQEVGSSSLCGIFVSHLKTSLRIEMGPGGRPLVLITKYGRSSKPREIPFEVPSGEAFLLGLEYGKEGSIACLLNENSFDLGKVVRFSTKSPVRIGFFVRGAQRGAEVKTVLRRIRFWRIARTGSLKR